MLAHNLRLHIPCSQKEMEWPVNRGWHKYGVAHVMLIAWMQMECECNVGSSDGWLWCNAYYSSGLQEDMIDKAYILPNMHMDKNCYGSCVGMQYHHWSIYINGYQLIVLLVMKSTMNNMWLTAHELRWVDLFILISCESCSSKWRNKNQTFFYYLLQPLNDITVFGFNKFVSQRPITIFDAADSLMLLISQWAGKQNLVMGRCDTNLLKPNTVMSFGGCNK